MGIHLYEKHFTLTNGMFDEFYGIKPHAYLDIFQRIAGDHADILGVGTSYCEQHNYAWIVVRQELYMYDNPIPTETVIVKTFPHAPSRVEFKREYELTSLTGKLYAKACASWVLVDINTFKILKSDGIYPSGEFIESILFQNKLTKPKNVYLDTNYLINYTVKKSDIDIYHHMNNAKYAELIFDLCDYKALEIKHLVINYINQIKQNEIIKIYKCDDEYNSYITGINGDEIIFTSQITKK